MDFDRTHALVTGGASGLGAGVVRAVTAAGGRALIVDLPSSAGAALAAEIGDAAAFVPTDVTDTDQVAAAVATAVDRFGHINLAVNCAGVSPAARVVGRDGTLFPLDVFRQTVEINLIGLFDVVRRCAGAMATNEPDGDGERGVIVNVASIAAIEGQKGQAAYSASKGGVLALTLPLARDLATQGIRVATVCPGIMDTAMLADADEARRQALLDIHVFPRRLGTPEDFATLVRSICLSKLLNGEVIRLDAATRL